MKNYIICLIIAGIIGLLSLATWITGWFKTLTSAQPVRDWIVDINAMVPFLILFLMAALVFYWFQRYFDGRDKVIEKEHEVYLKYGFPKEGE